MKNKFIKSIGATLCAAVITAMPVFATPPEQVISANITISSDEPRIISNTLLPGTNLEDMLYYTSLFPNAATVGLIDGTTTHSYVADENGSISFYIHSDGAECVTVHISLDATKHMLMRTIIKPRSFNSYTVYNLFPGETYKFDIKSTSSGSVLMY